MDEKKIFVEIITPQSAVFSGKADAVTIPGAESPFQVLYNHAAIVSALEPGIIIVKNEGKISYYASDSGFAEVRNNIVSILVQAAVVGSDIDLGIAESDKKELTSQLQNETSYTIKDKLVDKIRFIDSKIKAKSYYS